MKFMKTRKLIAAAMLVMLGSVFALTGITNGANEQTPAFNIHKNVGNQGDEADFVRVRKTGTQNTFSNNVDDACVDGQEVSIQVYVHNGASQGYNGTNYDGTAVARDTKLSLTAGTRGATSSGIVGKISASNAPSVMDTATFGCNGKAVDFEFVQGSAIQTNSKGNQALNNSVFTEAGAPIGFESPNGIFPACWEFVTIIYAKVKISVKQEPVVVKECTLIDPKRLSRTKYEVTANARVQNTTVTSYTFTVVDSRNYLIDTKTVNTSATSQTYTFEQNTPGTYKVKAVIQTAHGQATGDCEKTITVEEEPKTPAYSCDEFRLKLEVNRKANVSFVPKALNGATFKDATVRYNADGSTKETVTTNAVGNDGRVTSSYTYAQGAKNVEVVATVRFMIPGDSNVKEVVCKANDVLAARIEHPKTITSTGAGSSIAGIFAAVTVAGAAMHRKMTLRRNK